MEKDLDTIRKEAIVGYSEHSGIELTDAGDGWAEGRVEIKSCHLNPSGAVHGGIIFCLGDVIGGIACYTLDTLPTTVSTNVVYMHPMLGDRMIYASAKVIKNRRTTMFADIRILNEQKEETARLQAVYYNLKNRKKA